MPHLPVEDRLFEHCVGAGCPFPVLLNTGVLADDWVDRYFELLTETRATWAGREMWPARLVAAIHLISWHTQIRYEAWRAMSGARNAATEAQLPRLRTASELFLLAPTSALAADAKPRVQRK